MLLKILYGIVALAVIVLSPLFVKAQRNGPTWRSLTLKMIAATGYMGTGLLAMCINKNFSQFSWILFGALIMSWIGDLFLHLWQTKVFPAIGFLGFLSAHFFFIAAFLTSIRKTDPDRGFFSVPEVAGVVLFCAFFLIFSHLVGTELKGLLKIPIVIYGAVITTMFCKATVMGVSYAKTGAPYGVLAAVVAIAGAALFVSSDFTIAMLMFNPKHKKNYPLKMYNIVSYFLAELLLSSLPLFIGSD
ncbi:MAG: hypothetical protein IJJ85_07860 [Clostridia bacterium]|nr:hypothetical protein [Clostridia bacterium]